MKKHIFLLVAGILALGTSCSKIVDLEQRIAALEKRVEKNEADITNLRTTVEGVRAIATAMEENVYVTEVRQIADGYTIFFSDKSSATIKNGTPGESATSPTVGFTEIDDGILVWTVNGQPLKNGDQYIPVTATPENPEFKFEDDTWYVRFGNGEWTECGKATSTGGSSCDCSLEETDTEIIITIGGTTVTIPKAPEDVPTNLSAAGKANCYIVAAPGYYSIDPVKGNSDDSVGEVASASVIWETLNTDTAPLSGSIVANPGVKGGKVVFTVPEPYTEGNALVAAKDESGNILWSWHIWVTDDEIGEITLANNAGILMDRYIGAIGNTPGDTRARGFFYQWGRKDPFMGVANLTGTPFKRYSVAGTAETQVAAGADLTIAYTIAHPTAWGLRDTQNNDWLTTGDATTEQDRWAKDNRAKALYDPCPAGWQVPGNGNWWKNAGLEGTDLTGITYDETNAGILIGSPYCTPDSWWPATGQYANGGIRGVVNYFPYQYGGTWTGCTVGMSGGSNNASRVSCFMLTTKKILPGENTYKQFGHAVRCRKI